MPVRTERNQVSFSDFEKELAVLDSSSESTNILIYGDSNAGKTWLTATAPGRLLFLPGESGYKSAARRGAKGKVRFIPDTATAWTALDWLESGKYRRYDFIIVDGVSTLQERFRLNYAAEAFDANPAKRAHRNLPDRPDYFNTQNMMKSWMARLVDLPVNCIFTAHAWRTEKTDADLLVYPGIQGKVTEVANYISGLMDVVGYLEVKAVRKEGRTREFRRLLCQRSVRDGTTYFAGDKFNALGRYIDNPTIPDIMARIEKGSLYFSD